MGVSLRMTAVAFATALAACEPCAGVANCTTAPRVSVQGRIVDVVDGHPIPRTQISLVKTDSGSRDSATTTTDDQGNFQAEVSSGSGTFDVVVAPPGVAPYRVKSLSLSSSTVHGEGHVVGVWVATPIFAIAGELYYRAHPAQLVEGATVTFVRTGGVPISLAGPYTTTTDASGRAQLLTGITAGGLDDVIGVLTVNLPGALGTTVIQNFHLTPSYVFRPQSVRRFGVGPQLSWISAIYNRATVDRVPGTTVTFTRTGGIAITPESFTTVTNQSGEFVFPLVPLAQGTVIGDLTIVPPAPFPSYVKQGFQIPTFDADQNPFLASFGVGPHLPWDGTVECNKKPAKGVTVFVVRVGGIAADPPQFYSTTDADGHFNLSTFKPHDSGTLLIDLEFTPPPGSECIGLNHHSYPLPTIDFDSDIRFIATWVLPQQ